MKRLYRKAKNFFDEHERYLMPATMVFGFVMDSLTLRRIDLLIENLVIVWYLILAVCSILYINTYKQKLFKNNFLVWLSLIAPYVLQYAFGALFSAFIVFYARSATWIVSWPFLIILFGFLLGNEFFRKKYERLHFHLSILYLALFAYSVFALPVLLKKIGNWIFAGSGLLSLFLISLVIFILYKIDPAIFKKYRKRLIASILSIYLLFNFLYYSNIIPPIPLAMKASGVYHDINKVNKGYRLSFENPAWHVFWRETSYTYHWRPGEKVYVFNSIFAPTKFNEEIYHRWSYYDEVQNKWVEKSKINFTILGGRANGYRGYSYKTNITPGKWRVDVITDTDQILGRIKFEVKQTSEIIELESKVDY